VRRWVRCAVSAMPSLLSSATQVAETASISVSRTPFTCLLNRPAARASRFADCIISNPATKRPSGLLINAIAMSSVGADPAVPRLAIPEPGHRLPRRGHSFHDDGHHLSTDLSRRCPLTLLVFSKSFPVHHNSPASGPIAELLPHPMRDWLSGF
jgi:hypothetical protein